MEVIVSCKPQPKHFNNFFYHATNRYSLNFGSIKIQKLSVKKYPLGALTWRIELKCYFHALFSSKIVILSY